MKMKLIWSNTDGILKDIFSPSLNLWLNWLSMTQISVTSESKYTVNKNTNLTVTQLSFCHSFWHTPSCSPGVRCDSPPLDKSFDECGVALSSSKVQQGHSPEGFRVDQVFGFGPACAVHHLLTHDHYTALKRAACLSLAWQTLWTQSMYSLELTLLWEYLIN